jgi:hypothetical protein
MRGSSPRTTRNSLRSFIATLSREGRGFVAPERFYTNPHND